MKYFCCDERRRNSVLERAGLNGIDFLEVLDNPADQIVDRQHTLYVHFLKDLDPDSLKENNVWIEGGERIRNIKITDVNTGSPPESLANVLVVNVESPGDFSTYTLHIVQSRDNIEPPVGIDRILSAIDFSFKVACPSEFDCKPRHVCQEGPGKQPDINYLAKDYSSFRQLMLDRMSALVPEWMERNPADPGIALVELLAYVGDYLSYRQDAVATEAYLGTARKRTSVRRHARLVDYFMHEGSNARVWVQVCVSEGITDLTLQIENTKFITKTDVSSHVISPDSDEYRDVINAKPVIFELMHSKILYSEHNEIQFYTWGARECCLPKGATRATLHGRRENLKEGDIMILAEIRSPKNGRSEDADPTRRHAVCLTEVNFDAEDPVGEDGDAVQVTEIRWHSSDALPFPLCVSARIETDYYKDLSVALGNIVLADHGLTIDNEPLGTVPDPNPVLDKVLKDSDERCDKKPLDPTPPRFRPKLKERPLTQVAPFDPKKPFTSARGVMDWSMRDTVPKITLKDLNMGEEWRDPMRDLLNSGPDKKEFVVEMESDGTAYVRFGDNKMGIRPVSGTAFTATYRIGNGVRGNIGAETIAHIVSDDPDINTETDNPIERVWNPLDAKGGREPETIEQVRQKAPSAFRRQERAVTPADYAEMTKRCDSSVQRTAASFRWTGSWHTVFLTVDRFGGEEVDGDFETLIRKRIEKYRMAGHDIEVDGPRYVSLEVEMVVCVKPGYFKSDVKSALLELFSNMILPDGRRGVFHPDNFTFGQSVYLSPLYAAAQATPGVASVRITTFQQQGINSNEAVEKGKLELGRLEIARLDNDPNFREHGVLNLIMRGGR